MIPAPLLRKRTPRVIQRQLALIQSGNTELSVRSRISRRPKVCVSGRHAKHQYVVRIPPVLMWRFAAGLSRPGIRGGPRYQKD